MYIEARHSISLNRKWDLFASASQIEPNIYHFF